MTIQLANYFDSFKYEINPPGENLYPNMTQNEMLGRLIDAFWEMRMTGFDFLAGWTCDDNGNINPQTPNSVPAGIQSYIPVGWYTDDDSGDIGREIIQAIVLFAGYRVALTAMMNVSTMTQYRVGPWRQ